MDNEQIIKITWSDWEIIYPHSLPKTWNEYLENYVSEPTYYCTSTISDIPNDIVLQHVALIKLHQLRDCYRQGWKPDWSNDDYKWEISIFGDKIGVRSSLYIVSFLSFQTKELATEFLNNFRDLIEQAKDLI